MNQFTKIDGRSTLGSWGEMGRGSWRCRKAATGDEKWRKQNCLYAPWGLFCNSKPCPLFSALSPIQILSDLFLQLYVHLGDFLPQAEKFSQPFTGVDIWKCYNIPSPVFGDSMKEHDYSLPPLFLHYQRKVSQGQRNQSICYMWPEETLLRELWHWRLETTLKLYSLSQLKSINLNQMNSALKFDFYLCSNFNTKKTFQYRGICNIQCFHQTDKSRVEPSRHKLQHFWYLCHGCGRM